jgi:ubiquinone/menaquinone biosynthesis C-methylase UbiE
MSTSWLADDVADGFENYDDLPERTLGYPCVFRALGLDSPDVRQVLDYGCGPGKVAERMVHGYDVRVVAVDASPPMLEIARGRRTHPGIDYRQVVGDNLTFLPEEGFDAAMSCYVFINIGSLHQIRAIVTGIYRVLRPGARYAILDTNPDTTGIAFSTFRSGEPGRTYATGEQRRVSLIRPDGDVLELLDFHWPRSTYQDLLRNAGFTGITTYEPLVDDDAHAEWDNERRHPPFLITVGQK